jgi:hypothetical protein
VITEKHFAIVRAALTFWDEEMQMTDDSVYQHYLHSVDQGAELTAQDVAEIRYYFNNVELKVALIDNSTGKFDSESPVDPTTELSFHADLQTLIVVLVPRP